MAQVEKNVLIAHSAERMFTLVDGCEDYPQFLPWCASTLLRHRDAEKTSATLHINYRGVKSSFTTENRKIFPESMHIRLVEGPFRHLEGAWYFRALSTDACKIVFQLQYEFSSKLLEKIVGPVFRHIADTLVDAFVRRADTLDV